jgi:hypothetical protein
MDPDHFVQGDKRPPPPNPITIGMKYQEFVQTAAFKGLPSDIAGCVIPTATNTKPSVHVDVPATVLNSSAVNMLPRANAKKRERNMQLFEDSSSRTVTA